MTQASTAVAPLQQSAPSLVEKLAGRYDVDASKLLTTLKATAFRVGSDKEVTNEQMMALLIVADQYKLNPFTKELFAFPDKGGVVPVVSIDGWNRIVNQHPEFDGVEFSFGPPAEGAKYKGAPSFVDCRMHRRDRSHPVVVREFLAECWRPTGPWESHPARMLRHKSFIQCARIAFGFAGIYDVDEAERITDTPGDGAPREGLSSSLASINQRVAPAAAPLDTSGTGSAPASPGTETTSAASSTQPTELTFAAVADAIAKAENVEQLDLACDLVRGVTSEKHRAELDVSARRRRKELAA